MHIFIIKTISFAVAESEDQLFPCPETVLFHLLHETPLFPGVLKQLICMFLRRAS